MNSNGFSLIEIAVSIMFIVIIGLFTAQMLAYAARTNQKAQDMDYAADKVMTVIEQYKAGVFTPHMIYYDRYWNELDSASDEVRFILYAERTTDDNEQAVWTFANGEPVYVDSGGFSVINAYVIDNEIADIKERVLVSVDASHYIQY